MERDRPAEVEITSAMVQAGGQFLREPGRLAFEADGPDEALVRDFLAARLSEPEAR